MSFLNYYINMSEEWKSLYEYYTTKTTQDPLPPLRYLTPFGTQKYHYQFDVHGTTEVVSNDRHGKGVRVSLNSSYNDKKLMTSFQNMDFTYENATVEENGKDMEMCLTKEMIEKYLEEKEKSVSVKDEEKVEETMNADNEEKVEETMTTANEEKPVDETMNTDNEEKVDDTMNTTDEQKPEDDTMIIEDEQKPEDEIMTTADEEKVDDTMNNTDEQKPDEDDDTTTMDEQQSITPKEEDFFTPLPSSIFSSYSKHQLQLLSSLMTAPYDYCVAEKSIEDPTCYYHYLRGILQLMKDYVSPTITQQDYMDLISLMMKDTRISSLSFSKEQDLIIV